MMVKVLILSSVIAVTCGLLWVATTPPSYYEVTGARLIGPVPDPVVAADIGDVIKADLVSLSPEVPGHDEVVALPGSDIILVSGRDQWIWLVDVAEGAAERLARSPLSPTGGAIVPGHPDQVYFCMARLDYNTYEQSPGVYRLDMGTKRFTPVVTRVPVTGKLREDGLEIPNFEWPDREMIHPLPLRETRIAALDDSDSRPLQFCNDLAVSRDGRHIYITEPFSNPVASSGLGAIPEGITLARNGRVWRYDTDHRTIGLLVENIVFADGVLIEYDAKGRESGLLISETVNFRIGRAHLAGKAAGTYDVLWDNLPGMPDGLDRDAKGRVWVALIKDRTPLVTWMHANAWIKPLVLRIPPAWLPPSPGTGILALSPDASRVLAYSHHDGSRILDISVVAPVGDGLFLPSFDRDNAGVHYLPVNAVLPEVPSRIAE